MNIRWVLLFLLLYMIFSCTSDTKDIRNYYFPLKELTEGLVYEYQSVNNDTLAPDRWYYRSFVTDSAVYLTSTYYDPVTLTPTQLMREEMVSNGMMVNNLYLFETDSTGKQQQIEAQIIGGSIFPFEVRDSGGIFLFKTSWQSKAQNATYTLIKNRRYVGDTTFVFKNQRYDAVIFSIKELIEQRQEGALEQQYSSTEWYAKGLGLVYYRKDVSPTFVLEYRLVDRYPMEQLEGIFKQKLQQ
ncbi:MAG: hypothetical protein ACK4TA_03485 [Saprospiraceae bacterium]